MSEEELLAHVIDKLATHISELVFVTTEMSLRISELEKNANQPSSASNSSETSL